MSLYANICGTLIAAEAIRNGGRIMNRKESFALRVKSALASASRHRTGRHGVSHGRDKAHRGV